MTTTPSTQLGESPSSSHPATPIPSAKTVYTAALTAWLATITPCACILAGADVVAERDGLHCDVCGRPIMARQPREPQTP